MADRYEINHNGEIVVGQSALCADQTKILQDLFSQYGWKCTEEGKEGSCHKLLLEHTSCDSRTINVYSGTIRNESRNAYEKKIQLGTVSDPRKKSKKNTIILGIYVFNANDSFKDAIFVGYPVDERINYNTNPSIRGTFVNKILIQAKTTGFVYDEEHNSVGFRSDFIYYYLSNYYNIHYEHCVVPKMDDTVDVDVTDPKDQKEKFKIWMSSQLKANGETYSTNTITSYIGQMERGYDTFEKFHDYESVFQIQDAEELKEYMDYLFNAEGFDAFNEKAGNKACSNGFVKYGQFIAEKETVSYELIYDTSVTSDKARNRILFGAPGTGKSFTINRERKALLGESNETDYERVTFHPDYSYANFVGAYKPVPFIDRDGKDAITYEYVPGPFMRVYVNALKSGRTESPKPYLLIIEEINRANVAAVFGDVFQLLDRDSKQVSEYPIQASEDIKKYLAKELGGNSEDYSKIKIPNNMFIWATMNSADQGVFPMDTAFKRRWDFTYLGINNNEDTISGKYVCVGQGAHERKVEWNELRKAINEVLLTECRVNEDKLMGPFFISMKNLPQNDEDSEEFIRVFKHKVLMYLFDDAGKQKRATLFDGCSKKNLYSAICEEFEEKGIDIFGNAVRSCFPMEGQLDSED